MNLEDLGNLGEFLGSVGVIVSLIYVGIEIRRNTSETKRTNARQTATDHAMAIHALLRDSEIAEVFVRGIQDLTDLTPVERYRFDIAILVWLQAIEQAFTDFRNGSMDQDMLVGYCNAIPSVIGTPGGRIFWEERKLWFSHAFRNDVEKLLSMPPEESELYTPEIKPETVTTVLNALQK